MELREQCSELAGLLIEVRDKQALLWMRISHTGRGDNLY